MEDNDISIDLNAVRSVIRRRLRLWLAAGALLWICLLLAMMALAPRKFTATASVALQQGAQMSGAGGLAALMGTSGSKNYTGVLQTRRIAERVARETGIQDVYHLDTPEKAAALLQKGVEMTDRRDGLLYISVTLPAPPKLSAKPAAEVDRIREATAAAADAYVAALGDYLKTTNSDRDVALIREARQQMKTARAEYDAAVATLARMIGSASGNAAAGAIGGDSITSTAVNELQSLYVSRAQLEAEIRSAEAARSATRDILSGDGNTSESLPTEDPLLSDARNQVRNAAQELRNLRVELSETNPEVVAARERLRIAQERLSRESEAIRRGRTSDAVQLSALQAKRAALERQIAEAERKFRIGRSEGSVLERQKNEVTLRLDVLRATATQYATLSVSTVAGDSMMDVMDSAEVPRSASPGLVLFGVVATLLTAVILAFWVLIDYLRAVRRPAPLSEEYAVAAGAGRP